MPALRARSGQARLGALGTKLLVCAGCAGGWGLPLRGAFPTRGPPGKQDFLGGFSSQHFTADDQPQRERRINPKLHLHQQARGCLHTCPLLLIWPPLSPKRDSTASSWKPPTSLPHHRPLSMQESGAIIPKTHRHHRLCVPPAHWDQAPPHPRPLKPWDGASLLRAGALSMGTGSSRGGSSCLGAACEHSSVSSSNSANERGL